MRLVLAGRWPCGLVLVKATPTQNVRTLYGAQMALALQLTAQQQPPPQLQDPLDRLQA